VLLLDSSDDPEDGTDYSRWMKSESCCASHGEERGAGTRGLMFATVNEHLGGTVPLQSPKKALINTFINSPPTTETGKEGKKVRSWPH